MKRVWHGNVFARSIHDLLVRITFLGPQFPVLAKATNSTWSALSCKAKSASSLTSMTLISMPCAHRQSNLVVSFLVQVPFPKLSLEACLIPSPAPNPCAFCIYRPSFPKNGRVFSKTLYVAFPSLTTNRLFPKQIQYVSSQKLQKQTFRNSHHKAHCKFPQLVFTCYTESSTLQDTFLAASLPECFCLWLEASAHTHLICYILFPKIKGNHFPRLPMWCLFPKYQNLPFPKAATFSKAAASWISW